MTPSDIKALSDKMGGQQKLAEKLGTHQSLVSLWVSGKVTPKAYRRPLEELAESLQPR